MFKTLKLRFFRKHEDLTIDFLQGLIAIRGANEAGKTTVQEAIMYALFGTKGLRQSLADVVTYGQAETALQVTLQLVNGTTVTRSKRGAEITNTGVLCTGQTECTKYFEKLLGCNADMAAKLMMAKQSALQGALTGGPTEAAQMIETLADFNLIDRVVDLIQNKLPTGNTVAAEEALTMRQRQLEELQAPDTYALEQLELEEASANVSYGQAYEKQKAKSTELQGLDVAAARRFMVDLANAKRDLAALEEPIAVAFKGATADILQPDFDAAQIEVWRRELMGLKDLSARQAAYEALRAIAEPEVTWDGTSESFQLELHRASEAWLATTKQCHELQRQMDRIASEKITETSCAFCGKDLTAVPEVIRRNVEADTEYAAAQGYMDTLRAKQIEQQKEHEELQGVQAQARAYETAVNRYGAFVITINDRYPFRWQWSSEPPPPVGDAQPAYNDMIARAEKAHQAYNQAIGRRQGAQQQLATLQAQRARLEGLITQAGLREVQVSADNRQAEQLEREVADLGQKLAGLQVSLQQFRGELALARQRTADYERTKTMLVAQLAAAQTTLDSTHFNNALVKKVRSARPVISDKLWSIVLASVSAQFSQIRGVSSVITRSDTGFKCDGQEVAGLSGSTLDALGLAIRIALTKTFLPNSRFMMLDEPGAACDDERESNMLGLIASSDFDQTLLVTHSALADSFASQVVSL